MIDYLVFCAGLTGGSDRVSRNEEDSRRKKPKVVRVSEEDKKRAKREFEHDFNVKEMT